MAKAAEPEVTPGPEVAALADEVLEELAAEPPKNTGPKCPHCKEPLREENDVGDHLHCDSPKCIDCCFEPGADGPVLRAGYKSCPSSG